MNLKETTQTKQYVKEVFERALTIMDIEHKVHLVFSAKEYNALMLKEIGIQKHSRNSRLLGQARMNCGVKSVLINIGNHKSVKGLNDTIVHELLHTVDFNRQHGKSFDNTVEAYLKQLFDYGYDEQANKVKKYEGSKY
jgi:hypothetical protein